MNFVHFSWQSRLEQSHFNPLKPDAAGGAFTLFVHRGCYLNSGLFIMHGFVAFILKKPRNEKQTHKAAFVPSFTVGWCSELTTSLWLWSETS